MLALTDIIIIVGLEYRRSIVYIKSLKKNF